MACESLSCIPAWGRGEVFADSKDSVDASMKESLRDLCVQKGPRQWCHSTVTEVQEDGFPPIRSRGRHRLGPKQLHSDSGWGGRINLKVPAGSHTDVSCLFVLPFAYFLFTKTVLRFGSWCFSPWIVSDKVLIKILFLGITKCLKARKPMLSLQR